MIGDWKMIRTVKKVDDLPKKVEIIDREETMKMLVSSGVTNSNSTQMLNVWVNDEDVKLDCYKVTGGPVKERGMYFRKKDIELFIQYKKMSFQEFKKMVKDKEIMVETEEVKVEGQQEIDFDGVQSVEKLEETKEEVVVRSNDDVQNWTESVFVNPIDIEKILKISSRDVHSIDFSNWEKKKKFSFEFIHRITNEWTGDILTNTCHLDFYDRGNELQCIVKYDNGFNNNIEKIFNEELKNDYIELDGEKREVVLSEKIELAIQGVFEDSLEFIEENISSFHEDGVNITADFCNI